MIIGRVSRRFKNLISIGYWKSASTGESEYPMPQDYVDESWNETERYAVALYLSAGRVTNRWKGLSTCRICGKMNGSTCLSDGTFIWPQGFAHYIEEHGVRPPDEFVQHIMRNKKKI